MVLEVVDVWFDIPLTRSVFRCGFEHRPHKCSCLHSVLLIWEGAAVGLPRLTSWAWTSLRRALKRRRLCTGRKHLFGAFQLSSHHGNCNLGIAGLRRRGYKPLVSQQCLASLPGGAGMLWVHTGSSSQPPHPFPFGDSPAAARSQPCTRQAPSRGSVTTTGPGGEPGAGEGLFQ